MGHVGTAHAITATQSREGPGQPAAAIHFGTAAQLGTAVGHHHLICWSLGAQSMTACTQRRHPEAFDLARQAGDCAGTPLVEVCFAAAALHGVGPDELLAIARDKRQQRGGFDGRLVWMGNLPGGHEPPAGP